MPATALTLPPASGTAKACCRFWNTTVPSPIRKSGGKPPKCLSVPGKLALVSFVSTSLVIGPPRIGVAKIPTPAPHPPQLSPTSTSVLPFTCM